MELTAAPIPFTASELAALFVGLTLSFAVGSYLLERCYARKDDR